MKVFLVMISSLCLCGILVCFWAYATNRLPGVPTVAAPETSVVEDPLCSPCVERMASLLEMIEQEWEGDLMAFLEQPVTPSETAAHSRAGLSPAQREKAKQLFNQYGSEEGLRHLRETDPDAARQYEPPVRSKSGDDPSTR